MLNKFTDIVNNQSAQADKDLAVSTAKENLARANKEARDEVALAKEIDNAETLVTDENSVIDPANAGENAQFFSMNDLSVQPVSSVEINGVSVDPNKHQKTLKSFKLRNVTNWHRKLYFIAPAISVCAIAGALTPIAIVKPIKAMEPVITIDDDSSEGISVKSNNVRLNKDSTITLNCDDQDRIKTVNAYINDSELNQDQYSFDSMSNVVSIKAEAMTSVNVKLKVITDAPRFNVTISDNPSGLKNIKHKSYASFRKEFTFECELRDNYILEQNEFNNGLELTVNGRRLTDSNEVSVKQLNGNKYAITIHKGIVSGDIKLSGRVTKFNCNFSIAEHQKNDEDQYVKSVHSKQTVSYQNFDDINDIVTLQDHAIRPKAEIIVDDNGREIKLVEGNDYKINSNLRGTQYHYDLAWTDNGIKKIVGPVSMKLSASSKEIKWNIDDVETQTNLDIAVGMPCRNGISFNAHLDDEGQTEVKDIKIVEGNDLGYTLNDEYQLVPIPGTVQKTGKIKLLARFDNQYKDVTVDVVEPIVKIECDSHEILVGGEKVGYSASISPSYLKTEPSEKIKVEPYKWTSDDDNIIKVSDDGSTITVTGLTKGVTNLTATTKITNLDTGTAYNCVGKYRIDCVKPKFAEAEWKTVVNAAKTFYDEYYKENASKEDKIKAMKNLCNTFDDTEYIEKIDEKVITDPDKQVEAHLANFLGKTKTIPLDCFPNEPGEKVATNYTLQVIGINHDTIAEGDHAGKKALFTFDSRTAISNPFPDKFVSDSDRMVCKWDVSGINNKFCTENHKSTLYEALNSESPFNWYINWGEKKVDPYLTGISVYKALKLYFGDDCPIKKVTKYVGMADVDVPAITNYVAKEYNAYCFALTTAELSDDKSITAKHTTPRATKNEGSAYKYYFDEIKKGNLEVWKRTSVKDLGIGCHTSSPYFGTKIWEGIWELDPIKEDEQKVKLPIGLYESNSSNYYGVNFAFCI